MVGHFLLRMTEIVGRYVVILKVSAETFIDNNERSLAKSNKLKKTVVWREHYLNIEQHEKDQRAFFYFLSTACAVKITAV